MKKDPINKNPWTDDECRLTAYHEAGHAAVVFLYGEWYRATGIDMRPTKTALGQVAVISEMCPNPYTVTLLPEKQLDRKTGVWSYPRRRAMIADVLSTLAGPCAETRCWSSDDSGWFEGLFFPPFDRDIQQAWEMASVLKLGRNQTRKWLARCGHWCDELFDMPRLWRVVEAVASLLKPNEYLDGERLWRVMMEAWGGSVTTSGSWQKDIWDRPPLLELGNKWKHRLLGKPWR